MLVDVSEGALIVTQLLEQYPETYDESDPASYIASTVSVLYYNILGFTDFEESTGGSPYGNRLRWYHGSDNDWLLNLNAERVRADSSAQCYLQNYYQPTGNLKGPLVVVYSA